MEAVVIQNLLRSTVGYLDILNVKSNTRSHSRIELLMKITTKADAIPSAEYRMIAM